MVVFRIGDVTGGETAGVVSVDRRSEWWTQAPACDLSSDDLVMLIDADSMPGPQLRERMVAARAGGSGAVVHARVLPVETTQVEEAGVGEEGPNVNAPLRVSASVPAAVSRSPPRCRPVVERTGWGEPCPAAA